MLVTLNTPDPWAIPYQKFDTKNECIAYVNDIKNHGTLAIEVIAKGGFNDSCLLYTSPSPRDAHESRMPSSA